MSIRMQRVQLAWSAVVRYLAEIVGAWGPCHSVTVYPDIPLRDRRRVEANE